MARAFCLIGIILAMDAFMAVAWYFDVGHEAVEKVPKLNGKKETWGQDRYQLAEHPWFSCLKAPNRS